MRKDLICEVRRGVSVANGGIDDHRTSGCRRRPKPLASRGRDRATRHHRQQSVACSNSPERVRLGEDADDREAVPF